jgi:hypothetical protein
MGGGRRVARRDELMHALSGLLVCVLALPVWAGGQWQVLSESPAETISVELSSLERGAERVSFRVRYALRDGQVDPSSRRPVREILVKRMVDCSTRRVATLSRAVFSNDDAMINYQAVRMAQVEWQAMPKQDPLFKLACEPL